MDKANMNDVVFSGTPPPLPKPGSRDRRDSLGQADHRAATGGSEGATVQTRAEWESRRELQEAHAARRRDAADEGQQVAA